MGHPHMTGSRPMAAFADPAPAGVVVGEEPVGIAGFLAVCAGAEVAVDDASWRRAKTAEQALEKLLDSGATVYGVTTGYGASSGSPIPPDDREAFQLATIRSHACGTGPALPWSPARGIWLAKILSMLTGLTGAGVALVDTMAALLNAGFAPIVPRTGSLGASGDLIPSGHAALALLGDGGVLRSDGTTVLALDALEIAGVPAVVPGPRDGLSLVNGTAVTTSLTAHACGEAARLLEVTEVVAAAALEAFGGHIGAFDPSVTGARPHPGAVAAAAGVRRALAGVELTGLGLSGMHDPYAWRCLPQVHGAARDACGWASSTCETELQSCTDNPLILAEGTVVSGGNFHGAPLGLVSDTLRLAVGEVAALSRQRTSHLAASLGREPSVAVPVGGIGLTMVMTTATASLLEISSTGTGTGHWLPVDAVEDHVPNSTVATLHALDVLELARAVVAAEVVATAVVLQRRASPATSVAARWLTDLVDGIDGELRLDHPLADTLERVANLLAGPLVLPSD